MDKVIIPKKFTDDDLVVITRRDYERLLEIQKAATGGDEEAVGEEDVLQWSKEARTMKQAGTLPVLDSLKELR